MAPVSPSGFYSRWFSATEALNRQRRSDTSDRADTNYNYSRTIWASEPEPEPEPAPGPIYNIDPVLHFEPQILEQISEQDQDILYLYYCIQKYPMLKLYHIYAMVKDIINFSFEYTRQEILASGENLIKKHVDILEYSNPYKEYFENIKKDLSISGRMDITFNTNDEIWVDHSEDLARLTREYEENRRQELLDQEREEREEQLAYEHYIRRRNRYLDGEFSDEYEEHEENKEQLQPSDLISRLFPGRVDYSERVLTPRIRDQTHAVGQIIFPTLFADKDSDE